MKPIVLIIENAPAVTGSVKSILRSCLYLQNDFEFVFLFPTKSAASSFVKGQGFVVYEMPLLELRKTLRAVLFYLPVLFINLIRFRRIIAECKAQLIVVNDFYNMIPSIYKLLNGRVPYLTYVRFVPDRFPKLLVSIWCYSHFRLAEKIIAVSPAVLRRLKSHQSVVLVHGELPEKEFQFFPINPESRTILYLSNYTLGKGQEHALMAFAALGNDFSDWTLRFVGGDMGLSKNRAFKMKLRMLAEELHVSGRVQWLDFTYNVVEEYRQSSLVLNFSDSESFSLTCMEAMFMGRPVIATRSGGPEEMISAGVDGTLVEVGNVRQMTEAIKMLLSNASLRNDYGQRAHAAIVRKFTPENTVDKLRQIIEQAVIPDY